MDGRCEGHKMGCPEKPTAVIEHELELAILIERLTSSV